MKVVFIVFSPSGHTLIAAQKFMHLLEDNGIFLILQRLSSDGKGKFRSVMVGLIHLMVDDDAYSCIYILHFIHKGLAIHNAAMYTVIRSHF